MNKKYYEDKNRNTYEVKTPLEELMWKEIGEMWDELLPKIEERDKYKEVLDKIKEMTKDLFETEYEGIFKDAGDNCCERFYLLKELNKLLEEIE